MTRIFALGLAALLAAGVPIASAAAQPAVASARQAGLVGERFDGYLGMASTAPSSLRNQVAAINIRRRSLYSRLAAARGVTPQEVGITAGCSLLARVAVGEAYLLPDRTWRRLGAGQGAPRPDYCG